MKAVEKCPNCGKENPKDADYCPHCNNILKYPMSLRLLKEKNKKAS